MKPVVKVALPTKSTDSTNPRDFAFHSDYTSIKIFKKGGSSGVVSASSNLDISITHNIGFYPVSMIYVELTPDSGKWYASPFDVSGENTYISSNSSYTYANTTNLKFRIINNIASQKTIKYYYFILGHNGKET